MSRQPALSGDQRAQLQESIREFHNWLEKTLPGSVVVKWETVRFPQPDRDDWIMWVDAAKKEVCFNSHVLCRCSFEYFELIVIHEWFHLAVQSLPNKSDARLVKHGFGESIMKLLDVEADFYAARFFKECRGTTLIEILSLYEEGSRVFGDPRVLVPKLERFIGAILSIANMYFANPTKRRAKDADLYLPTIVGIHTDEVLYTVVARNYHFVLRPIHANSVDFANMMRAYTNTGNLTTYGYVELLLRFSEKALARSAPSRVNGQLATLRRSASRKRR